jgi:hypothetical protein
VWGEMGKQQAASRKLRESRALPAARPLHRVGAAHARAKATGQALASSSPVSARCSGRHLETRLFASAKAGRSGGPGPHQLWRDARGLPPSPAPAGARDRSRGMYTEQSASNVVSVQCRRACRQARIAV